MTELLEVQDLSVTFRLGGAALPAVCGVSWSVSAGRTLALVGESGSGKSVSALAVIRLLPREAEVRGNIRFEGQSLLDLGPREVQRIRGRRIGMIFQEPMSALNPVLTVGAQIAEVLRYHERRSRRAAWRAAVEMLDRVGVPEPSERAREYPHQFSGGMQQRAMIAMALACNPSLLIADEPTTALDVTVQAQILELLRRLQAETKFGILLISHDFGVVAELADEVCAMRAGRVLERAPVADVLERPGHPYTRELLRCVPQLPTASEVPSR